MMSDNTGTAHAELSSPEGEPYLRLEKTRFSEGESIFFWVGVKKTGTGMIPKKLQGTCRLTITRPDGTQKIDRVSWPQDGLIGSSWAGGWGLQETPVLGRYTLVFEFAGKKTAPVSFVVERAAILSQIHAEFVYGAATGSGVRFDRPVILTIRNESDQKIRFPYRDGIGNSVCCHFLGLDQQSSVSLFYPEEQLRGRKDPRGTDSGGDTLTWEEAKRKRVITLKPGETYRLPLSLRTALSEAQKQFPMPSGRYSVEFETLLQILIGEQDGDFATLSPVRVLVTTTDHCTIPTF